MTTENRPARCSHGSAPAICAECYVEVFAEVAERLAPLTSPGAWLQDGGLMLPGDCEEVELSVEEGRVRLGIRSNDPEDPVEAGAQLSAMVAAALARRLLEFAVEAQPE